MLIWMDGFDSYASSVDLEWAYYTVGDVNVNDIGLGTTSGRFGQGGVIFGRYSNTMLKNFSTPLTEIWTGYAFQQVGSTSNQRYAVFYYISLIGIECQLTYNPVTGEWAFWQGGYSVSSNVLIASGIYGIGSNQWHYIEMHYKISNTSNGIIELWIDGINIFNNQSANTTAFGQTVFYTMGFGGLENGTFGPALFGTMDDWYILDPNSGTDNITRLGDSRIETLVPISDAGPNQGTPSNNSVVTGQHYTMVDESQNDRGATFLSMPPVDGTEEIFGMSSLSSIPLNIWAVRVLNIVQKTDGGITFGNAVVRSSGVTEFGPNQQILSTFFGQYGIFETDPNTGNAWTYTSVNAADAGFTVV